MGFWDSTCPHILRKSNKTTEAVFRALLDYTNRLLDKCDVDRSLVPALGKIHEGLEVLLIEC